MTYLDFKNRLRTGMSVKVVNQHKYMNIKLIGKIGTVKQIYTDEATVYIDGLRNQYSTTGYFYLKWRDIEFVDEGADVMEEENNNMSNVTNYLNAVKIQYFNNTTPSSYIYANYDPDVKVGDLCVIKSDHHGLGLAKIVEVIDRNDFETCREIVAKVDTTCYDERVKNRAKVAELKSKMEERAKRLQDIALYQMLAEQDSAMAELLTEYRALPNV